MAGIPNAEIPANVQQDLAADPLESALGGVKTTSVAAPTLTNVREVAKPDPEKPIVTEKKEIPAASPAVLSPESKAVETPPIPDFDKALSENFGGKYKTKAELETALANYEKLNGEHALTKKEFEALKGKNPFVNDYVKKLNDYVAQGGDADVFHRVMRVDPDKLTNEQKISLQLQWQKNIAPDKADKYVANKYKLGDGHTDEEGNLTTEAESARLALEIDAPDADKFIREAIKQELAPPDNTGQIEARVAQWTPVLPTVKDNNNVIVFKGAHDVTTDFTVPHETLNAIEAEMNDIIKDPSVGWLPDKEGMAWANDYMKKEILAKHFPEILNAVINKMKVAEVKDKHNPTTLKEEVAPKQEKGQTTEQILAMLRD